jgi:hypothetical protein
LYAHFDNSSKVQNGKDEGPDKYNAGKKLAPGDEHHKNNIECYTEGSDCNFVREEPVRKELVSLQSH